MGGDHLDCREDRLHHANSAARVQQAERDAGARPGLTTDERQRLKALEREVLELKRANDILRKASAYFARTALDRRPR